MREAFFGLSTERVFGRDVRDSRNEIAAVDGHTGTVATLPVDGEI